MDLSQSPFPVAPPEVVKRAMALVPVIFRKYGVTSARGHSLWKRLWNSVNDKFAADQAIRQLIVDGRLEWKPVEVYGSDITFMDDDDGNMKSFPTNPPTSKVGAAMPNSGPVSIDAIEVTATDSLWTLDLLPDRNSKRSKRGPKVQTDLKADKKIFDAWNTKKYATYQELADELRKPKFDVKKAIDRQRKRRNK